MKIDLPNYILVGKKPVHEPDIMKWARWFHTADRHVAVSHVNGWRVSTVFIGIDHNFINGGPPELFETMIFPAVDSKYSLSETLDLGLAHSDLCERYSTWEEAEAGHRKAVKLAELMPPPPALPQS